MADRRYDYIEADSLIFMKKNVKDIMLLSEGHAIEMFPMNFEEFLWDMGDEMPMPNIRKQQSMGTFHLQHLPHYFVCRNLLCKNRRILLPPGNEKSPDSVVNQSFS